MFRFSKKKTEAAAKEEPTADEQPKSQPYRHIPVHAAADSMSNGAQNSGTYFDRQRIEAESRRRMKMAAANEANAGDAAYLQALARGALPRTPHSPYSYTASTPRSTMSRSGSGYFTPSMPYIADTDEDPIASHPSKLSPDTAHVPHWSSDSGYGSATPSSAVQSRTPSERGKLEGDETVNGRAGSDASGRTEHSTEPELSETSSDDALVEIPLKKKNQRGVLKVRRASPSFDDDANADARSIRSTRSTRSSSKQTRFEGDHNEAVPPVPKRHREEFAKQETRRQNRERILRTPSPGMTEEGDRLSLSALEGFKVNSKGQVLDEEGEWVGELIEGGLADCVRQVINASGQVIDPTGSVVGRVRVVVSRSEKPSIMNQALDNGSQTGYAEHNSEPYAYKGEIPPVDNAAAYSNYAHQRSVSLNGRVVPPPFTRHATTGMLALNSSHLGPAAGRRSIPYAVGVPGGRPALSTRHSYAPPTRRSALGSQEHSPVGLREGADSFMETPTEPISRTVSVRTTASAQTLQPKQRTYFTHGGRVTIDSSEVSAFESQETLEAKPQKTSDDSKSTKRKGRFSGMFHKKKEVTAK